MESTIVKHSIVINGRKTNLSLEDDFWCALKEIAQQERRTLSACIAAIDKDRKKRNLSSAIRVFVLNRFRAEHIGQPDLTPPALPPVGNVTLDRANELPAGEPASDFAVRLRASAAFASTRR